jgi:hypothetical protein
VSSTPRLAAKPQARHIESVNFLWKSLTIRLAQRLSILETFEEQMRTPVLTAVGALIGVTVLTVPALSQGAGLDGLHDKRQEGGRLCMSDHFHDGSGSGKTRKLAEADAARAWGEFTAWEYGGKWGSFRNAATKSMSCSDTGGSWSCSASARPCRVGR